MSCSSSYGMPFNRQTTDQYQYPFQTSTMPSGMTGQMPQTYTGMPMFPPSPAIGTTVPTGAPVGPSLAPLPSPVGTQITGPAPQTVQDVYYTPGFLKTQIGKRMRVEFLVGQGTLTDRTGVLIGVGASYILLREPEEDNIIMGDLYSVKFVTILL